MKKIAVDPSVARARDHWQITIGYYTNHCREIVPIYQSIRDRPPSKLLMLDVIVLSLRVALAL